MINKVILSVMTPDGLKEASVISEQSNGYVYFEGDYVRYCPSSSDLQNFFEVFIDALKIYPCYEK